MSWSVVIESPVSAPRLFRAAILDWHTLGPKLAPEIIASGTGESGDGGAGSVRQLNFTSVMPFSYVKERLDFVDHEKFECQSTIIEGGHLGTRLESASAHFKVEPTSAGGSIVTVTTNTKPLPGIEADEGVIAAAKGAIEKHFRAAEAYLLANPDAYV
uniref:Pathogenesis-related protein 10 n=1 Tax=Lilium regale TaxID=82328 RepID=W5RW65_LILRE|nr:pathogenesis-related protein 10 [Lilium regale]